MLQNTNAVASQTPLESFLDNARVSMRPDGQKQLVAVRDLPAGATVAHFEGPVVKWNDVPLEEIQYALLVRDSDWLLPRTSARFLDHSCDPNCRINEGLDVVTTQSVMAGDHLTISYNTLTLEEYSRSPRHYFWDPRWSFDCRCGQLGCVGRLDGYRIVSKSSE